MTKKKHVSDVGVEPGASWLQGKQIGKGTDREVGGKSSAEDRTEDCGAGGPGFESNLCKRKNKVFFLGK